MTIEIIPSILAADFGRLLEQVQEAQAAGANKVQIDVMDGRFVPNISVGIPVVRALSRATDLRLDVHLMIERPERYLDAFADAGAAVLTVHAEATAHLYRALEHIRARGLAAGAAVNPGTSLVVLEEVLPLLDVALVMTVNPGFGGQRFIPAMLPKIARLRSRLDAGSYGAALQADGGIDATVAAEVVAAGATQLVTGSAVFAAGVSVQLAISRLREAIGAVPGAAS
jgi:ribulose-phosphate 3-epimerase